MSAAAYLVQRIALERPCPYCKAQPGQPCRRPNGSRYTTVYGEPRLHAKREATVR